MYAIRFWVLIVFIGFVAADLIHWIFFDSSYIASVFSNRADLSIRYLFNNIGVFFGSTGIVLWLAQRFPTSDTLVAITLWFGLGCCLLAYWLDPQGGFFSPADNLGIAMMPFALLTLCCFIFGLFWPRRIFCVPEIASYKQYAIDSFLITILIISLGWSTHIALNINTLILPDTIDYDIAKIDYAFYGLPHLLYTDKDFFHPIIQVSILTAYELLPYLLIFCLGLAIAEKRDKQLHVFRTLIVPYSLAFWLYCLNAVSGPVYAFAQYPNIPQELFLLADGAHFIPPTARNGMPSMHFTGALLVLLTTMCLTRKIFFYLSILFVVLTFMATLTLGEHYLLDLIVAVPYAMALGTALLNPPDWYFHKRWQWWACILCFLLWEVLLLAARPFLIESFWFVRLFSLLSIIVAVACFTHFFRLVWRLPEPVKDDLADSSMPANLGEQHG